MKSEPAIIAAQWVVGLLICGGVGYYTAYRKGYTPAWWFLGGGGCLGLVILAFLPNTKDNFMAREKKLRLRKRGNLIGIIMMVLVIALHLWAIGKFLGSK